ncbi:hypothetical protein GPX89_41065 [Nocardia sp. ET3-3]|uniref:Ig-like domain-containing protein n=1 Tax=Nocardia terrae TaxID=2675851 RepID=A0A7K1VBW6_9NOCA|nr:hypothetical protein [Nocardia terrae]MVU83618.1 hypothetical protein [Nocardia terrae]
MRNKSSGRAIGAGLAGATAAAVVAVMSPAATADVDVITISNNSPTVGTSYGLHASLSGPLFGQTVYWSDNGTSLTPNGKMPWPMGESNLDWVPATAGRHVITASQGSSTQYLVVDVNDGSGAGTTTTTPVPPTTTTAPTTTAPAVPAQATPPTANPSTSQPSSGSGSGSGGTGSATGSAGSLVSALLRGLFGSS